MRRVPVAAPPLRGESIGLVGEHEGAVECGARAGAVDERTPEGAFESQRRPLPGGPHVAQVEGVGFVLALHLALGDAERRREARGALAVVTARDDDERRRRLAAAGHGNLRRQHDRCPETEPGVGAEAADPCIESWIPVEVAVAVHVEDGGVHPGERGPAREGRADRPADIPAECGERGARLTCQLIGQGVGAAGAGLGEGGAIGEDLGTLGARGQGERRGEQEFLEHAPSGAGAAATAAGDSRTEHVPDACAMPRVE